SGFIVFQTTVAFVHWPGRTVSPAKISLQHAMKIFVIRMILADLIERVTHFFAPFHNLALPHQAVMAVHSNIKQTSRQQKAVNNSGQQVEPVPSAQFHAPGKKSLSNITLRAIFYTKICRITRCNLKLMLSEILRAE